MSGDEDFEIIQVIGKDEKRALVRVNCTCGGEFVAYYYPNMSLWEFPPHSHVKCSVPGGPEWLGTMIDDAIRESCEAEKVG